MAVNIGPRIGIDGEAEYRKAIQNIIQETKTLKAEFEKISSDVGMNSFKKAIEQSRVLTQEIEAQQKRVQELQKGYQEAVNKWGENDTKTLKWKQALEEAETELNRLEAKLKEIPNAIEIIGKKFQETGDKIKAVGNKISSIGNTLTTRVTLPLVGAGTVAVNKFAEVDKTMTLTNQTMNNSAKQAELLNAAMKEAAANSTFGMSDAADATLNFARAGLTAEQAAATLAPAMNLAAGEGGDLNTVSAGLVATINGFGDVFDNASNYADIFASACNNSALDIDSLSNSMSIAAPIFRSAGYDVKDAALYMGVMADNGIDANVAANALKTGIARLAKPAKEGQVALNQLGIEIFNTDGSMKDSLTVQKLLHDSFANLSEQEQIAAASAIFGKNQMSNWLALINAAPSDVNELSKSLDNAAGTTLKMADAMMSGFGGSLEKLKSSVDVAATSFGEALAPTISKVADGIQKAVDWFNSLDQSEREQIAKAAMIVAAVGPVLSIGGKLISGIGSVISVGGKLISGVGSAIKVIGGIAPVVSNIGSVAGGVIPSIATALGGIGTFITGTLVPGIASLAAGIGSAIAAALPVIAVIAAIVAAGVALYKNWDKVKEAAGHMVDYVSNAWNTLLNNLNIIGDAISKKIESVKNKIGKVIDSIGELPSKALEWGKDLISNFTSGVEENFKKVRKAVTNAAQIVKNFLGFSEPEEGPLSDFHTYAPDMMKLYAEGIEANSYLVKDVIEALTQAISDKWNEIKDKTHEAWENVKEKTSEAWENVKDTVSELINNTKDIVAEVGENIKTSVSEKWNEVKDKTKEEWENIKTAVSDAIGDVLNKVREKMDAIRETVTEKVQFIKDKVGEAVDFIKELPSKAFEWGKDLISNFTDGIKEKFNNVKEKATNVAQKIKDILGFSEPKEGPLSDFHTYAPDMMELYAKGINDNSGLVTNAVDKVAGGIHYSISAIGKALQDSGVQWEKYTKDVRLAHDPVRTLIDFAEESLWAHLNTAEGIAKAQEWMRYEYKMTAEDAELTTATIKKTLDEQGVNWDNFSGRLSEAFTNASSNAKQALLDSGVDWGRYKETVWNSGRSVEESVLDLTEELEYNFDRVGGDIDILRSDMIGFFNSEYDIDLDDATRAVDAFVEVVSNGTNSASENLQNIANASGDMSNQFVLNVSGIASAAQDMSSAVAAAGEATSQAMISISGTVKEANREITVSHDETRDSTVKTLEEMVDIAAEQYKTMNNSATQTVEAMKNNVTSQYQDMSSQATMSVGEMKENITRLNIAIHENTTKEFGMTRDEAINKVVELRGSVSDEMEKAKSRMTEEAHSANEGVKNEFQNLVDSSRNWGSDIGENISNGIHGAIDKVKSAASKVADTIASFLHFSEPDVGPLSNFHTFAPDMMELFAKGIKDNTHLITDQIAKSFDFQNTITTGYGYIPDYGNTSNNNVNIGDTVINVYGAQGQDEEALAEIIDGKLNDRYMRLQMAWG